MLNDGFQTEVQLQGNFNSSPFEILLGVMLEALFSTEWFLSYFMPA